MNEEIGRRKRVLSINQRLIMIIIFFICIPFFALGWLWYKSSTATIERTAIDTNKRIIEQTNEYLDLYFSNLENSTYPFVNNPQIQQFLNKPVLTPYQYYMLSDKVEDDLFNQMIHGRPDIVGMSLVNTKNQQIYDYSKTDEMLDMKEIRQRNSELVKQMENINTYQILGVSKLGSTTVLTVVRKLHSNTTFLYEGLLVIDLNLRQIENICNNVSLGGFNVWIATADGSTVYHPDPTLTGSRVEPELAAQFKSKGTDHFRYPQSTQANLVIFEHSRTTNWIVAAEIPFRQLIGDLLQLRNYTLVAAAILLLLALIIVGGYSLSLTRSLTFLQRLMAKVENGDFTARVHPSRQRNDEIGSLYRSFFKMVSELNRLVKEVHSSKLKEQALIIKQKDSALQSMQSHINPHFLYNSLEIINSHAIIEQNREIVRMTGALAHMFRYNTGSAKQLVTLREELAHIRSYLDIQQARFRKLQVDIDAEEWALDAMHTVRFTLQPLVENAFKHGYAHKKPTFIGIDCKAEKDYFSIIVTDHGSGMDASQISALQHALEHESAEEYDRGIGLTNVHQRLSLTFGAHFGLRVLSVDDGRPGAAFEIRLPLPSTGN
ncbi:sensor histidine kinase [Paenibacillus sp. GCM10027626]|uniref:cache domain-containing sensor histidine kinase n=1 Tax=Paenibacillus sp. GCM10027626 TaxID=3273411 RepID=UPI00363BC273